MIKTLKKSIIGYKKASLASGHGDDVVVKLRIPAGAKVHAPDHYGSNVLKRRTFLGELHRKELKENKSGRGSSKLRASKALVLSITFDGRGPTMKGAAAVSKSPKGSVTYVPGKVVRPHQFSEENTMCAGGIHFFLSREQAKNYNSF